MSARAWAVAMVQATEATAAARLAAWVAGGGGAIAAADHKAGRLNPVRAHAIGVLSARVHALASAGFEPSRAP